MTAGKRPQVLNLQPSNEIILKGPFDRVVTSYLELQNPTDQSACFKVKTTAPRRYCVRPNCGIIEPGNKVKIAIMLQPNEDDSASDRNKHKFMVQSILIEDGQRVSIDSIWLETRAEEIMDSKLRCVFQMPEANENSIAETNALPSKLTESPKSHHETPANNKPKTQEEQKLPDKYDPIRDARPPERTVYGNDSTEKVVYGSNPSRQPPGHYKSAWEESDRQFLASAKNLSSSSLMQPVSEDYKTILLGLAMLFAGIFLGKYII